jgi:hypothetical protein
MFVDVNKGDLRLKPGSPCAKAGVRPEAWEKLGCRLPWKKSAEPKR